MEYAEAKAIVKHLTITIDDDILSAAQKVGQLTSILSQIMEMNTSKQIEKYYRGIK